MDDKLDKIIDRAINKVQTEHERTFLRLRITELEEKIAAVEKEREKTSEGYLKILRHKDATNARLQRALQKIADFVPNAADKLELIHAAEGYRAVAREALAGKVSDE